MKIQNKKIILVLAGLLGLSASAEALPTTPLSGQWTVNGEVRAIAQDPTTGVTYVGGDFNTAYKYGGNALFYNITSNIPSSTFITTNLNFNGSVHAAVADGDGGWFIGGSFTKVSGTPVKGLVHILANNTLDTSWTPQLVFNNLVATQGVLALHKIGTRLFVGGRFSIASGSVAYTNLVAFDLQNSGPPTLVSWNSFVTTSDSGLGVSSLASRDGALYIGGQFRLSGSTTDKALVSYTLPPSGTPVIVDSWHPTLVGLNMTSAPIVNALAVSNNQLIVGGAFKYTYSPPGGGAEVIFNKLMAFDVAVGSPTAINWNAGITGDAGQAVLTVHVTANRIFVGGLFRLNTGSGTLNNMAYFSQDTMSSQVAPTLIGSLFQVGVTEPAITNINNSGSKIFMVGFTTLGRLRVTTVDVDPVTGTPTTYPTQPWNPNFYSAETIFTKLFIGNDKVLVNATGYEASERHNILAITPENQLVTWSPGFLTTSSSVVNSLVIFGNKLFVGGDFTVPFDALNSFSDLVAYQLSPTVTTAPILLNWDSSLRIARPEAGSIYINDMIASGNKLYVAGNFGVEVNNNHLTSYTISGALPVRDMWNANLSAAAAEYEVKSIRIDDGKLYAGGQFQLQSASTPKNLIGFDITGATPAIITDWTPNITEPVYAVENCGAFLCFGGSSTTSVSALRKITKPGVPIAVTEISAPASSATLTETVNHLRYLSNRLYTFGKLLLGSEPLCAVDYDVSGASFSRTTWGIGMTSSFSECYVGEVIANRLWVGGSYAELSSNISDLTTYPFSTVRFAADVSSGNESATSVSIPVTLSTSDAQSVRVKYRVVTSAGTSTATRDSDFTLADGELTFAAGTTTQNIPLTIIDDANVESSETVVVELYDATGAILVMNRHTYTITDNDVAAPPMGGAGAGGASGASGVGGGAGASGMGGSGGMAGSSGHSGSAAGASGTTVTGGSSGGGGAGGVGGGTTGSESADASGCGCRLED